MIFFKISSIDDIYSWTKNNFLPTLNIGNQSASSFQKNLISDMSSILFGYAIIKQKRISQSNLNKYGK